MDGSRGKAILFLLLSTIALPLWPVESDLSSELIERARRFRQLVAEEKWDEARAMMSPDPRRWFEQREGEGRPWTIGPNGGPWSDWDDEFRSASTVLDWRAEDQSVVVRVMESNDYFRLLERGAVTNEITYFFDGEGRIDGLLIRAVGERPEGRTKEFLRWTLENEPGELRDLMPNGSIDPSGDHPKRFRVLLERWRDESGLVRLDLSDDLPTEIDRTPSGEHPIVRVAERFVGGWLDDDSEIVMSTLSDDAVLLPHHGVSPVEGSQAIQSFWFPPNRAAATIHAFRQTYAEVGEGENLGYVRGRFLLELTLNGERHSSEGNYLMLFRKEADGQWKITHRIWNDFAR